MVRIAYEINKIPNSHFLRCLRRRILCGRLHSNQKRKSSYHESTRSEISRFAPQSRVDFKTRTCWMCVSCPVNCCGSRNVPRKRREHFLLDRQSSLSLLDQLHRKIVQSLCRTSRWRNTHAHRTKTMVTRAHR